MKKGIYKIKFICYNNGVKDSIRRYIMANKYGPQNNGSQTLTRLREIFEQNKNAKPPFLEIDEENHVIQVNSWINASTLAQLLNFANELVAGECAEIAQSHFARLAIYSAEGAKFHNTLVNNRSMWGSKDNRLALFDYLTDSGQPIYIPDLKYFFEAVENYPDLKTSKKEKETFANEFYHSLSDSVKKNGDRMKLPPAKTKVNPDGEGK